MSGADGRPRLLILSFSPIASDARVLKQVRLFAGDYAVTTCGHGPAPEGVVEHLAIPDSLAVWRYDRGLVATRRYRRAYWANPAVAAAQQLLEGRTFDAVLANDVDAVGLALSVPSRGVHADLHEYAPRQKEDLLRWRVFVAPFIRWMCRAFVARAASATTVGQGIAEEYRRRFGIDAGVVTNAAPYVDREPRPVHRPIRLVHSGAALHDRNIMTIVDAVDAASGDCTLDLYLTPNDPAYLDALKARQNARVTVHDPVPYDELNETLSRYDVGVHVLPPVNFNNTWALPNKFFDYVQARLGLVIGPSPEMARVVHERGLGAVADDFSTEALVREIERLDPADVVRYKAASAAAARDLSAEAQVEGWHRAIDRIVGR
ncbi:glycosyltransferase family 1 protein [Agromyces sp. H3Y2-19a]|uniref:glycosyltransferase family 1 protein n=1 Tax=Agromyces TaxID=33877 RepID=UPI0023B9183C|nr:glycosyltransferase family 1 protein [Agromyces chromiiresistens]MDF0514641.1 glycosyltransferase family 1 protein [Agromyces chromiiresistens]